VGETWANGLDLHLDLSGTRVRFRLENALRDAVRSGRLAAGTRLPSSRTLAGDLGIARNTVAEVYTQLVAEGWLTARTGSGTTVAGRAPVIHRGPSRGTGATPVPFGAGAAVEGAGALRYDLTPGHPDLSAFPRAAWLAAARRTLATGPDAALGYGHPAGSATLRAALAGYLGRTRGVVVQPDGPNIVICSGFSHGLAAICGALRDTGADSLAVEEYGLPDHWEIVVKQGLTPHPLRVDAHGAALGTGPMLLTPAHQFPLGVTLSPERRRAVRRADGIVIEDDYDGEFRYDRQPTGAVQALAPDNVIYCGTASKSLVPGVRIGWLVVPAPLLAAVTAALGPGPSALDQLTLAEFIESGGYDRQVRRVRLEYRRRRDRLLEAVEPLGLSVGGIAAGLHAVVELPSRKRETEIIERGRARGLGLQGLGDYAFDASRDRAGLVINYAGPPRHAFTTALARLRATLTELPTRRRGLPLAHGEASTDAPGLDKRRVGGHRRDPVPRSP
jgi:GntR family transcriptional regulator / MocR family aminotransferase